MENSLTRWWQTGEVGTIETKVSISDQTLVKMAITVVLVCVIVMLAGTLIKKKQ